MLKKIINRLKEKTFTKGKKKQDFLYSIGGINIVLPPDHALPIYQERYKAYDQKIGIIARIVWENRPNTICVDIGANVGDTAAAIRCYSKIDIIAIEGNSYYLKYLRQNAIAIGRIQIVECLVGTDQNSAINYELENNAGTAKLVSSSDSNDELKFSSLEEIINEHEISRDQIGLIKIDTDGFDFKIILSNKKLIKEVRPVLFFEYDITFADEGEQEAGELLEFLVEIDYNFLVYDNFGNILYDLDIVNSFFFYNINRYIRSCRASGGGIFYLDVLAIPKEFKIIKAEILQFENRTGGHYAI